jgi:hypothetical protein
MMTTGMIGVRVATRVLGQKSLMANAGLVNQKDSLRVMGVRVAS